MTEKRTYVDYLHDMLEAAERAEQFVMGMDFPQFRQDQRTIFAVIRALEVLGEAARNIPPSVRGRYPLIPWEKIVGMRNKLIHGYFGVDLDVVWETVQDDIPPPKPHLVKAIAEATGT